MNIKNINEFFIKADRISNYIPIISTISNLFDLFQKILVIPMKSNENISRSHYYTYLQEKKFSHCIILLVPVLGNIVIGLYDLLNDDKAYIRALIEKDLGLDDDQATYICALIKNDLGPVPKDDDKTYIRALIKKNLGLNDDQAAYICALVKNNLEPVPKDNDKAYIRALIEKNLGLDDDSSSTYICALIEKDLGLDDD